MRMCPLSFWQKSERRWLDDKKLSCCPSHTALYLWLGRADTGMICIKTQGQFSRLTQHSSESQLHKCRGQLTVTPAHPAFVDQMEFVGSIALTLKKLQWGCDFMTFHALEFPDASYRDVIHFIFLKVSVKLSVICLFKKSVHLI